MRPIRSGPTLLAILLLVASDTLTAEGNIAVGNQSSDNAAR